MFGRKDKLFCTKFKYLNDNKYDFSCYVSNKKAFAPLSSAFPIRGICFSALLSDLIFKECLVD